MLMELRSLIWKVLLEQVDQNTLIIKNKYVGEGKPISEDDFNKIVEVTGNKFYLLSWLTKKVGTGIIKAEDVYKYKEYFDLYEKNKPKFKHKDIHLYKTAEDVQDFISEVIALREGNIVFDEIKGKDNYVSQNEIEKLEQTDGIKYLGMYDNKDYKYQVFQVFGVNQWTWKEYRDILGRCKGRSKGAKIEICTIGEYSYFKRYLKNYKNSSYFLLYNLDDQNSPYQLHYESGQFMDKNDRDNHKIKQLNFFEFVGDRVERYSLYGDSFISGFEIPVKGKGFEDDKGKKQGLWKEYWDNGKLSNLTTYSNDKKLGPFVVYYENGKIDTKGYYGKDEFYDKEYEEYNSQGRLIEKGQFKKGDKVGVWTFYNWNYGNILIDFSSRPIRFSGLTEDNKLRYVTGVKGNSFPEIRTRYGKVIFFFPSGKIQATGNFGVNIRTGKWKYFNQFGKVISEGKYLNARRSGIWEDIHKTKNGETYKFVADFVNGVPKDKIYLYDMNGHFVEKIKPSKITPYWEKEISYRKFGYD